MSYPQEIDKSVEEDLMPNTLAQIYAQVSELEVQ